MITLKKSLILFWEMYAFYYCNWKEKCSDESVNLYSMRFDDPIKRFEEKVQIKIIYLAEIVNANTVSLALSDLENLIADQKAEIIFLLADTEFDIIEGGI